MTYVGHEAFASITSGLSFRSLPFLVLAAVFVREGGGCQGSTWSIAQRRGLDNHHPHVHHNVRSMEGDVLVQ